MIMVAAPWPLRFTIMVADTRNGSTHHGPFDP
jgi:hypothetical protein